jgi:hypothetical protein
VKKEIKQQEEQTGFDELVRELEQDVTKELEQTGVITERLDQKVIKRFVRYSVLCNCLLNEAIKVTPQNLSINYQNVELAFKCEKIVIAYSDRLGLNPRARGQMKLKEQTKTHSVSLWWIDGLKAFLSGLYRPFKRDNGTDTQAPTQQDKDAIQSDTAPQTSKTDAITP